MTAINGHTTRAGGTVLTAAIYNADHVNHISNAAALNATKLEGATPPVADGHAAVWDGTSGALLRTAGFAPANAATVASDQATTTAGLAARVLKAGDTMTGLLTISAGAANANAEWLQLRPTDFAANKPYFYISKELAPESFEIGVWDGVDNVGTINFAQTILQHRGNDLWDVSSIASQAEAEAGAINTKPMTPLTTAQAIAALSSSIHIGGALTTFNSVTTFDVGVAGATGAIVLAKYTNITTSNFIQVSANGGTNFTQCANQSNIGSSALIVAKGNAAVVMLFDAAAGNAFILERLTLTAGAGNVMVRSASNRDFSGIRIM